MDEEKDEAIAISIGGERLSFNFALKSDPAADQANTFRGVASVFGNMVAAWIPTKILKGAFKKTIAENKKKGRVKILYQHDLHSPIGVPLELAESDEGLEVYGKISDTTLGRDVMTLLKDEVLTELSIGFDPLQWEMKEEKDEETGIKSMVRYIKEIRLWELSIVTFAADDKAKVMSVHAVVPFQDWPLADEARAWDGSAADNRFRKWASTDSSGDKDKMDWAKYRKGFLWYDSDDTQNFAGYKMLISDVIDGSVKAV